MFGFQTRSQGDGIIPLLEWGPTICAIVKVLWRFLNQFTGDAILEKWVNDLSAAGRKASVSETQLKVSIPVL